MLPTLPSGAVTGLAAKTFPQPTSLRILFGSGLKVSEIINILLDVFCTGTDHVSIAIGIIVLSPVISRGCR